MRYHWARVFVYVLERMIISGTSTACNTLGAIAFEHESRNN